MLTIAPLPEAYQNSDLRVAIEAGQRFLDGRSLYGWNIAPPGGAPLFFHYPPATALLFSALVPLAPFAAILWKAASVAAITGALGLRLGVLALLMPPLVVDLFVCNGTAFAFAAAIFALRSPSRARFLVLGLIIALAPRTPLIPLIAYFAIVMRGRAWPMLAGFGIVAVLSVLVGSVPAFVGSIVGSGSELASPANLGPSRTVGWPWVIFAVPFAGLLTVLAAYWRDRTVLGVAMLFAAPYWLPQTLLYMLLGPLETIKEGRGGPTRIRLIDGNEGS